MSIQILLSKYQMLSPELQKQLDLFLEQLLEKSEKSLSQRSGFGVWKGKIRMKDDFDDPIPGFETYLK